MKTEKTCTLVLTKEEADHIAKGVVKKLLSRYQKGFALSGYTKSDILNYAYWIVNTTKVKSNYSATEKKRYIWISAFHKTKQWIFGRDNQSKIRYSQLDYDDAVLIIDERESRLTYDEKLIVDDIKRLSQGLKLNAVCYGKLLDTAIEFNFNATAMASKLNVKNATVSQRLGTYLNTIAPVIRRKYKSYVVGDTAKSFVPRRKKTKIFD